MEVIELELVLAVGGGFAHAFGEGGGVVSNPRVELFRVAVWEGGGGWRGGSGNRKRE